MTVAVLLNRLKTIRQPAEGPVSLNRQLFQLAWPSLVENFLQTMLGVVDLIFVGKLGADAIGGIGLGNQWMFTLVVVFFGLSIGNSALVARAIGAGNVKEAQHIAKQSLILALLLSLVLALIGNLFSEQIIGVMGATPVVTKLGADFLRITSTFCIFIAIMVIGGGTLRGAGDTRTPMLITAFINLVNIALDYGLIFGNFGLPNLGAIGSAYATTTARAVGATLILYVLFKRGSVLKLQWRGTWQPHLATVRRIFNIGGPAATENLLFQLGFLTFSAIVTGLGTADLAAMQVAFNIGSFSILPAFGFGVAASTMVGQSLGANDLPRAEASIRQAVKSGIVYMSLVGVGFYFLREPLFRLYTSDPEVIRLGGMLLIFSAAMQPFQAVAIILSSGLRGAGDTRATMVITTICVCLVRVGVGYLFGIRLGLGLAGVWIGWCSDFITRSALIYLRYRMGRWKHLRV